jgi:AraC-like DNA-binding protein
VPFSDIVGETAYRLEERLSEAPPEKAMTILQRYLHENLDETHLEKSPKAIELAQSIINRRELTKIQEIDSLTGISLRQVQRKFNELIGVSPKKLSILYRFDTARRAIVQNPNIDLLDLAFQLDYFDYSHFTKDFQQFFGLTPHAFRGWVGSRPTLSKIVERNVVFLQDEDYSSY